MFSKKADAQNGVQWLEIRMTLTCVAKKLTIPKTSRPNSAKIDEKTKHTLEWSFQN